MSEQDELKDRRWFLKATAATGIGLGGFLYGKATLSEAHAARNAKRADGRARLPPGQTLIKTLRPMGGTPGSPEAKNFKVRVHGLVKKPITLDFNGLYKLEQVKQVCDVHCVTRWSVLGARFDGVRISDILKAAGGVSAGAKYVIIEAAHGYTANLSLSRATQDLSLIHI